MCSEVDGLSSKELALKSAKFRGFFFPMVQLTLSIDGGSACFLSFSFAARTLSGRKKRPRKSWHTSIVCG